MSEEETSMDRNSPPVLPPESPGSSVSTRMQEEYSELLRFATGASDHSVSFAPGTVDSEGQTDDAEGQPSRPQEILIYPREDDDEDGGEQDVNASNVYGNETASNKHEERRGSSMDSALAHIIDHRDYYHTHYMTPAAGEMGDKLDEWFGKLKIDILAELTRISLKNLETQRRAHDDENKELNTEKHRLQREVNRLSELVNTCEQSMSRKDSLIENLSAALAKQKDKVLEAQAFYSCRAALADERRQKFTEQLAANLHRRQLKERVFKSWFGVIQTRWRQRLEKRLQEHAQGVCKQLSTDYEDKIKSLNQTIDSLQRKIHFMQQEKEDYMNQAKKAFMRGMCALNMETMSVFATDETASHITGHSEPQTYTTAPASGSFGQDSSTNNNAFEQAQHFEESGRGQQFGESQAYHSANFGTDDVERLTSYPQPLTSLPSDLSARGAPSSGTLFSQKTKTKSDKTKTPRPSTAPTSGHRQASSRAAGKKFGVTGQSMALAPPMASVVVERHNPVTKQTVGKATASRYPKPVQAPTDKLANQAKADSQPSSLIGHSFQPIAGQTASPKFSSLPSVKVVD